MENDDFIIDDFFIISHIVDEIENDNDDNK